LLVTKDCDGVGRIPAQYSQLSIIQGNGGKRRKATDNPKPWLTQKQSRQGIK
jgi:hypothetical protein